MAITIFYNGDVSLHIDIDSKREESYYRFVVNIVQHMTYDDDDDVGWEEETFGYSIIIYNYFPAEYPTWNISLVKMIKHLHLNV